MASSKESSTRRQLFLSNSPPVKKLFDDPIEVIDVPSIQSPIDTTPPSSPGRPLGGLRIPFDEEEDTIYFRPCPPTPNRPKVFSRSPALAKEQKKVKARRMSDQCGTLSVNYKNDFEMFTRIAASCSVPDLRVTPAAVEEEDEDEDEMSAMISKPSGTPVRVLKYKTNVNPFSPTRGYPKAKGEFQIPTERDVVPRYVSDFEQHFELGKGSFGTVVLCLNRTDGWTYAIKKLTYSSERMRNKFLQEAYALAALGQHANIVRYYGSWEDKSINAIYIQFEWCKGGSLKNYSPASWTQITLSKILRQVCLALSYMHARGFSHGDVKPDNILVDSPTIDDNTIYKLCDLGQINGSGDGQYIAPEILLYDEEYLRAHPVISQKADIFSLGISLYVLAYFFCTNKNSPVPQRAQIMATEIVLPEEHFTKEFVQLLRDMLSRNYEERPSADQILDLMLGDNLEWKLEQEKKKVLNLQDQIKQLERELAKARKHRAHKRPNKSSDVMLDLKRNLNGITLAPPQMSYHPRPSSMMEIFEKYNSPVTPLYNNGNTLELSPPVFSPGMAFSFTSPISSKNP